MNLINADTITDWYGNSLAEAAIGLDQQYTICRQLYLDTAGGAGTGTWGPGIANWHVGSPSGPLQTWVNGSDAFFAAQRRPSVLRVPYSWLP